MKISLLPLALLLGLAAPRLAAQEARASDVASPEAIVAAVYDVISGGAGEERDWDRWRSLFLPGARLIPVGMTADGQVRHRVMSPEDYVEGSGPMLKLNGFFEQEVFEVTEAFGQIAHRFSTYESRRSPDDAQPFQRGINSFQLMNDGTRWWIVSIMWDSERPGNPIPERYLGG